jgi:hypothetical protein
MNSDEEEALILSGKNDEINREFANKPRSIAGTLRYQAALMRIMKKVQVEGESTTYSLGGGSGYGCEGWTKGEVVASSERLRAQGYPEYLFVLSASSRYIREDGLSFGVGDESGRVYSATCREATAEEAAPLVAQLAALEARRAAKHRLRELAQQVQAKGECPAGDHVLEGERLFNNQTLYGGGDWWVVTSDAIWYVQNNGADGDDWSRNNVQTGGAGAIGWRVPRTAELEDELRALASA